MLGKPFGNWARYHILGQNLGSLGQILGFLGHWSSHTVLIILVETCHWD